MLKSGALVGGPLDGQDLAAGTRPTFIFVAGGQGSDGRHRDPRVFKLPGNDRYLYRSLVVEGDTEVFIYAGHTHRHCDGCGGFNEVGEGERNPSCQLCGTSLTPDQMAPS
jgi:hypothetical protein